jgi:hypothetical protein
MTPKRRRRLKSRPQTEYDILAKELYEDGSDWDEGDLPRIKTACSRTLDDTKSKFSGRMDVDGVGEVEIRHASSGNAGKETGATVFFYRDPGNKDIGVIAAGKHRKVPKGQPPLYEIDSELGQEDPPFEKGRTVGANGEEG